jgi:hypothetical protein
VNGNLQHNHVYQAIILLMLYNTFPIPILKCFTLCISEYPYSVGTNSECICPEILPPHQCTRDCVPHCQKKLRDGHLCIGKHTWLYFKTWTWVESEQSIVCQLILFIQLIGDYYDAARTTPTNGGLHGRPDRGH